MTKVATSLLGLALVLAIAGCKKDDKPEEQTTPPPAPSPVQATEANVATPSEAEEAAIPVEEDFEEEAATTITPENLEQELDKLEQEIQDE